MHCVYLPATQTQTRRYIINIYNIMMIHIRCSFCLMHTNKYFDLTNMYLIFAHLRMRLHIRDN